MKRVLLLGLAIATVPPAEGRDRTPPAPPPRPVPSSIEGLPIGALPRQQLPAHGCAAYLWSAGGSRQLVAMAGADPALLRVSLGGTPTDLVRTAESGGGTLGLSADTEYAGTGVTATLQMQIVTREALTGGAQVPEGTLQIDRPGQDTIVLPVAGLIGCAA